MTNRVSIIANSFAQVSNKPLELLEREGIGYVLNTTGRKLVDSEIIEYSKGCNVIIAGTENLLNLVNRSDSLKLISRIGVGLNSIPLKVCKTKKIQVTYTPNAVTDSVAELTIAKILNSIKYVSQLDKSIRKNDWERILGGTINQSTIGIVGFGRIAKRVRELILPFKPSKLLIHELNEIDGLDAETKSTGIIQQQVELDYLLKESDVITLHLPLTEKTSNLINQSSLSVMKKTAFLINTSRGGIINEDDLYQFLLNNQLSGAALDVFENEPYDGKLIELENILLTPHVGSYTDTCRARMEMEAVEDVIHFFKGEALHNLVPDYEFESSSI